MVAEQLLRVAAVSAQPPGKRSLRGSAKCVAKHKGEHGRRRLVCPRATETGRLVYGQKVIIMAGLALAKQQKGTEGLQQPGVASQHLLKAGCHGGGRVSPAGLSEIRQRDLIPGLIGSERNEVVLAADVPVDRGGRGPKPVTQRSNIQALQPSAVEQVCRRADDLLARQRVPRHGPNHRVSRLALQAPLALCSSAYLQRYLRGCGLAPARA